jgi:heat shock protein HslJ
MRARGAIMVLVLLLSASAVACGGDDDDEGDVAAAGSGADLVGTTWVLTSYERRTGGMADAVADASASLTFRPAGTLAGSTGCNDFGGTYETSGTDLSIDIGPSTLKACPDPATTAQESAVMEALPAVASYAIDGEALTLRDDAGAVLLTYRPGVTGLTGSSWQVIGVNNGSGAVTTSALTEALTATFGEDGAFTGFGGCNNLSGSYSMSGPDGVSIGPLMSTKMSCGAEIDQLEVQYAAALEAAATYELAGDTLTLRDASGAAQVTATPA